MSQPEPAYSVAQHELPRQGVLRPIQKFIRRSTSGGLILIGASLVALFLANWRFAAGFEEVLHTPAGVSLGAFELSLSLLHWINEGLMAIFFLLIGLEIKREVLVGELSTPRAAGLPILAALGGVTVPALIYSAFNAGGAGASGWGIPMATDIAFALGIMALLGPRVPFGLKVFLTAVAIVDDLLAVLVIALFYSGALNVTALLVALGFLFLMTLGNFFGIRSLAFFLPLGVVVWLAFLQSGLHATLAGVLVALTIPARYAIDKQTFLHRARGLLGQLEAGEAENARMLTGELAQSAVLALEDVCEQVQAPLQKLEHLLHVPVHMAIVPLFALANAGVLLAIGPLGDAEQAIGLGILGGLVVGKPVGLLLASWLAVRSGIVSLPPRVTWRHMIGVGCLAGIGFTMSLFITTLGFGEVSEFTTVAKLSVFVASLLAGLLGFLVLRATPVVATDAPVG